MLYRFSIVFLIGLCLVACSSGSMQEESVPVIRFKPDEARTLKISELFDGNPPYAGRGGISFAANVGEILRVLRLLKKYNHI